jgi:hypothetical protein
MGAVKEFFAQEITRLKKNELNIKIKLINLIERF